MGEVYAGVPAYAYYPLAYAYYPPAYAYYPPAYAYVAPPVVAPVIVPVTP
jgi:hypothetical protein